MAENKRLVLIDYLKALGVVLVIITHSDFINDAMLDKSGLFYLLCVNKAVPMFMFLSGYVFALSAKNYSLGSQYAPRRIISKLLRLTVPTVIAYAVFVAIMAMSGQGMTPVEVVKTFVASDYGRGSYYYPVMVQFVLLAPLMWELVKRYNILGVAVIGLINMMHEICWTVMPLPEGLYRILFLRYLLIAAFGMYFGLKRKDKQNPIVISAMALIGLWYILLPYFTDYEYNIFTIDPWNKSAMISAFYVAAVMYVVFKLFGSATKKGRVGDLICAVGGASYHVMYTQMMYFILRPAFDKLVFDITTLPLWSQYAVDIVVPCALGVVFCVLDNKVFGKFYTTKA